MTAPYTLADWLTAWRLHYSHPYPNAPKVASVDLGDPLSGQTYNAAARKDADRITDYMVTTENPHRGYLSLAPRVPDADTRAWTRAEYMSNQCSHDQYWSSVVRSIGESTIKAIVLRRVAPADRLVRAFVEVDGHHLNTIPLRKWDACDPVLRQYVNHALMAQTWNGPIPKGQVCWSLSDTVCTLKAAARMIVEGLTPEQRAEYLAQKVTV